MTASSSHKQLILMSIQLQSQTQDFIFPLPHFFVLLSEAPHHVFFPSPCPESSLCSATTHPTWLPPPSPPRWCSDKESACQRRRCEFDPWVKNIPWRREWLPTPVFLPGEFQGQKRLAGYSPGGHRVGHDGSKWTTPPPLQTDAESPKVGDAKQKK